MPPSIGIEFSKPFDSSDLGGGGLLGRKNLLVNLLHTWSEIPRVLDKPSRQTLLSILLYVRFLINLATMQNSLRPS